MTACVGSCMWVFPLAGPGRTPLADPRAWPFVGEDFDCIELYHDDHWHRRPGRGRRVSLCRNGVTLGCKASSI